MTTAAPLAHAGGVPELLATLLAAGGLVAGWIGVSRLRGRGFATLPRAAAPILLGLSAIALIGAIVVPTWFETPAADGPRPRSTATISVAEPRDGETVAGDRLRVDVRIEGGRIVEQTTTNIAPDTGHVHLYLDGELLSMTYGSAQELDITGLAPGAHRLLVEFVAADHVPFDPRVRATVTFVKDGS